MARFQDTATHPDVTEKHAPSKADIEFLAGLQAALNTQDTMGQASPRYWVIAQSEETDATRDNADTYIIYDDFDRMIAERSEDAAIAAFVDRLAADGKIEETEPHAGGVWYLKVHGPDGDVRDTCYGIDDLEDILSEAGLGNYTTAYARHEQKIVQGPVFLTHAACEDHLRKYGYNYDDSAHAYALTAFQCPEFERLLEIVSTVLWNKIDT